MRECLQTLTCSANSRKEQERLAQSTYSTPQYLSISMCSYCRQSSGSGVRNGQRILSALGGTLSQKQNSFVQHFKTAIHLLRQVELAISQHCEFLEGLNSSSPFQHRDAFTDTLLLLELFYCNAVTSSSVSVQL